MKFDQESFLKDLKRTKFELKSSNPDENYRFIR